MDEDTKLATILTIGVVGGLIIGVAFCLNMKISRVTPQDIEAAKQRYGCVRTNEFVGKNADLLYICEDGWKYTSEGIRQAAFRDKNK